MSKMGRLYLILTEQAQELGYDDLEQAQADGYEVVGEKLLETSERALRVEKEEQLNKLDEVIAYLKEECDDETCERPTFMIRLLNDVEKYIKERS